MTRFLGVVGVLCALVFSPAASGQQEPDLTIEYSIVSGARPGCGSGTIQCSQFPIPGNTVSECATTPAVPGPIVVNMRVRNTGGAQTSTVYSDAYIAVSSFVNSDRTVPLGTLTITKSPAGLDCSTNSSGSLSCRSEYKPIPAGATYDLSFTYTPSLIFRRDANLLSAISVTAGVYETFVVDGKFVDKERANALCLTFVTPTCTPVLTVPATTQAGVPYTVSWTPTSDATGYEIQESTNADFTGAATFTTTETKREFVHADPTTTTYYYRVRPTSCPSDQAAYSNTGQIIVVAPQPPASNSFDLIAPFGVATTILQDVSVSGLPPGGAFSATTDRPYVTVSPSSGTVPASGTITVRLTAQTAGLAVGANTATLIVTADSPAGLLGQAVTATRTTTVPVSVNLVTPVSPFKRLLPPANALIIPVVARVNGAAAPFRSDVRLLNGAASALSYNISFTPSRASASAAKATVVSAAPGQSVALNDVVRTFFGIGATGAAADVGFGSLEIRPVSTTSTLSFASSRTYAATPAGTLGQFVPAIPFSAFLKADAAKKPSLSLQQIAQSQRFRTNFGIIEGSGSPASGTVRVLDGAGRVLGTTTFDLQPGEHQQINNFVTTAGVPTLDDGRLEVVLESATGAIAAYASVLDNVTTDPFAITGVDVSKIKATRYVVPGIADLNNPAANFHSDLRIFNGGASATQATLTYFPQGGGAGTALAPISIAAGEVKAFDNVLPTLFNISNSGGSVLITTPADSSLVATASTYSNAPGGGSYGQFIPGVSPAGGIAKGNRALQVLQLEESPAFRSNLGIVELTGNPARVRITLFPPEAKASVNIEVDLAPNEFRQFGRIIASMLPGENIYNARMTVEVIDGTGRVTAYASVLDNATQDPTYVPAQ